MFCRAKEELSLQARKIKRDSEMLQQKECDLQTATEELSIATAENAQKRDQIRGLEAQVRTVGIRIFNGANEAYHRIFNKIQSACSSCLLSYT